MGGQRRLRRLRDGGGRAREGEKERENEERRARAHTPVIGRLPYVVLMPHHRTLPWPASRKFSTNSSDRRACAIVGLLREEELHLEAHLPVPHVVGLDRVVEALDLHVYGKSDLAYARELPPAEADG